MMYDEFDLNDLEPLLQGYVIEVMYPAPQTVNLDKDNDLTRVWIVGRYEEWYKEIILWVDLQDKQLWDTEFVWWDLNVARLYHYKEGFELEEIPIHGISEEPWLED